MIYIPDFLRPHICVDYPQSNKKIFEEWFYEQDKPKTEREYLGVFWTSYLVNNQYGEDREAVYKLQEFIDSLPRAKKYYTIFQFDNGCCVDFKDLDIVTFGMSYRLPEQKPTYNIPLIGQMGERLILPKKYKASFIGTITHPIREKIVSVMSSRKDFFVSTQPFSPHDYFEIMAESEFVVCPRGYGLPSFRSFEAIHNYAIPIYVSNDFLEPYGIDFNEYGVKITENTIDILPTIIDSFSSYSASKKRKRMQELYNDLCTYQGVFNRIIETLNNEN